MRVLLISLLLFSNSALASTEAGKALYQIEQQLGLAQMLDAPFEAYGDISENVQLFELNHAEAMKKNPKLRKDFTKTKRLAAIQARFKLCLKKFGVENSLGRRILAAAMSIDSDAIDCEPDERSMSEMLHAMEDIRSTTANLAARRGISKNLRRNVAQKMASIEFQVASIPKGTSKAEWAKRVKARVLNKMCGSKRCGASERKMLGRAIDRKLKHDIKSGKEPQSPDIVANRMSSQVDQMNTTLSDPIFVTDTPEEPHERYGAYFKKPARAKELAQERHNQYLTEYFTNTSDGVGVLFHTEELKKKVGAPREFDRKDVKMTRGSVNIYRMDVDQHDSDLTTGDIRKAKSSYMREMQEVLKEDREDMNKVGEGDPEYIKDSLKDALKNYPLAAAQMLLENPDSAKDVCAAINEIEDEEDTSASRVSARKMILAIGGIGAMTLGGLASLTGIGASAGVPLMIFGASLTGGEAIGSTYDYLKHRSELNQLVQAQLAGSTDYTPEQEAKVRSEISSAAWSIGTTLGFSAAGGMGTFLKKASEMSAITNVSNMTGTGARTLRRFENTGDLKRLKSQLPTDEYAEFAARLITMPAENVPIVMREVRRLNKAGGSADDYRSLGRAVDDVLVKSCAL